MNVPILTVYDNDGNAIQIPAIKGDTGAKGDKGEKGDNADVFVANVSLPANGWSTSTPYTQSITVVNVDANSLLNCCPNNDNMNDAIATGYMITVENNAGIVNFYAIGNRPTNDITIKVAIYKTGGGV